MGKLSEILLDYTGEDGATATEVIRLAAIALAHGFEVRIMNEPERAALSQQRWWSDLRKCLPHAAAVVAIYGINAPPSARLDSLLAIAGQANKPALGLQQTAPDESLPSA